MQDVTEVQSLIIILLISKISFALKIHSKVFRKTVEMNRFQDCLQILINNHISKREKVLFPFL